MEKILETKKLLFVTDFEKLWFDALRSLKDLRRSSFDHVVFLNVIERTRVAMRRGSGYGKSEEIRLREIANIRFIEWAEYLFEEGLEVGVYIVVGSLVKQVVSAVEKEGIDLIVMGHLRKNRLERLYSGSEVNEIIRRAKTPLLVFKYKTEKGDTYGRPFKKPILAVDWPSSRIEKILDTLTEFKDAIQELNIIHVASPREIKGNSVSGAQQTRKDFRRKLEELCDRFEERGVKAMPHIFIGDTVSEIEKAARECRATMIIAGSSGKGEWTEKWVGSVSGKLASESVLPTLVLPA